MAPTRRDAVQPGSARQQDGQESDDGAEQEQTSAKDEGIAYVWIRGTHGDGGSRPVRFAAWLTISSVIAHSCQACRRKKAKCSRLQPCSQCVKNSKLTTTKGQRLRDVCLTSG